MKQAIKDTLTMLFIVVIGVAAGTATATYTVLTVLKYAETFGF